MKIDKKTLKSLNVEKALRSKQAAIKLVTDSDLQEVRDDLSWINASSQLIEIAKKQNRLHLSVIVAFVCLAIASLSWSVNIPSTPITFEVQTSKITVTLSDNWSSRQRFFPERAFVNKVVKAENLDETIRGYTSKFIELPPLAVGMAKMLLNESMHNDLLTHFELESITASNSAGSEDFKEGVRAFVEKRKPIFQGK